MDISYKAGSVQAKGELLLPKGDGPFPTIILLHAWFGKDHLAKEYGEKIVANLGFAVFLADYFGEGKVATSKEEATSLIGPLFFNRDELRKRTAGAFEALSTHENVDPKRIGAIGFCFGGLAAIELYKIGLPLVGVATFHAVLGYKQGDREAKRLPIASNIKGSILVLHGYLDPSVSKEDRDNFEKEMDEAKVDWQFHTFGQATHAFTNKEANAPKDGLMYDPLSDERSFEMMGNFFTSLFKE